MSGGNEGNDLSWVEGRGERMNRSLLRISIMLLIVVLGLLAKYVDTQSQSKFPSTNVWNTTVALVMVRNEGEVIERCVKSLQQHVGRYLFICDTGSTDDTLPKVLLAVDNRYLAMHHVREGFHNFEQARNACRDALIAHPIMAHARWVALADADFEATTTTTNASSSWPAYDVNTIQIYGSKPGMPHNSLHMLIRSELYASNCRYRLWTHEFLDCTSSGMLTTYGFYSGFHYVDHADGSARPVKLTRDIALLRAWLHQVNETALRPRALYYLARSYEDSNLTAKALQTYARHNVEQTHTNYLFYAHYRIAHIVEQQWESVCGANASLCALDEVETAYMNAFRTYDGYFRREPFYRLAHLFRRMGDYHKCLLYSSSALHLPPLDHQRIPLFIETSLYGVDLEVEHSFCVEKLKPA